MIIDDGDMEGKHNAGNLCLQKKNIVYRVSIICRKEHDLCSGENTKKNLFEGVCPTYITEI